MPLHLKIITRFFKAVALLLSLIVIFAIGFRYLVHPFLNMDEGYYITASLKILSGDIFLSRYVFDKGYLHALFQIPGILLFGTNHVGFRASGAFCFLASFPLFVLLLCRIQREKTFGTFALSLLLGLAIYLQPTLLHVGFTTLGEPFLLFFLLMSAYLFLDCDKLELKRPWALSYAAAGFIKLTALLWLPLFVSSWLTGNERFGTWVRRFLKLSWPIWSVGLVYLTTSHFAALQIVGQSLALKSTSALDRLTFWFETIQSNFGGPLTFALAVLLTFGASLLPLIDWFQSKKDGEGPRPLQPLLLWVIPFWIHCLWLLFFSINLYDRYLTLLLPQWGFLLAQGFLSVNERLKRGDKVKQYAFSIVSIAVSLFLLTQALQSTLADQKRSLHSTAHSTAAGRLLYRLIDEFPGDALIQYEGIDWLIRPFQHLSSAQVVHCHDDLCLEEARVGRPLMAHHYTLALSQEGAQLLKAPFLVASRFGNKTAPPCLTPKLTDLTIARPDAPLITKLLKRMRVDGTFQVANVQWHPFPQNETAAPSWLPLQPVPTPGNVWRNKIDAQRLEFDLIVTKPLPSTIKFGGQIDIAEGPIGRPIKMGGRYVIGFRIDQIFFERWSWSLTDLAPTLYGSYFIPIESLDLLFQEDQSIELFSFDPKMNQYQIKLLQNNRSCGDFKPSSSGVDALLYKKEGQI